MKYVKIVIGIVIAIISIGIVVSTVKDLTTTKIEEEVEITMNYISITQDYLIYTFETSDFYKFEYLLLNYDDVGNSATITIKDSFDELETYTIEYISFEASYDPDYYDFNIGVSHEPEYTFNFDEAIVGEVYYYLILDRQFREFDIYIGYEIKEEAKISSPLIITLIGLIPVVLVGTVLFTIQNKKEVF